MITLFHNSVSTCSQKVRWVLAEKGLEYESREINLLTGEQHAGWYSKLNPDHVVPTIVHDDQTFRESSLIMLYLDEVSGPDQLVPTAPADAYRMRFWMHLIDHRIHSETSVVTFALGPRRLINAQPEQAREAAINQIVDEAARARRRSVLQYGAAAPEFKSAMLHFLKLIADLEGSLQHSDWLAGSEPTLADGAVLPYVLRLQHLDLMSLMGEHPALMHWLSRMVERASFERAIGCWIPQDRIAFMKNIDLGERETIRGLIQEVASQTENMA
ncbi:MAG: glutathione S-transferase family protein [Parvibaculaceae bacterium]